MTHRSLRNCTRHFGVVFTNPDKRLPLDPFQQAGFPNDAQVIEDSKKTDWRAEFLNGWAISRRVSRLPKTDAEVKVTPRHGPGQSDAKKKTFETTEAATAICEEEEAMRQALVSEHLN